MKTLASNPILQNPDVQQILKLGHSNFVLPFNPLNGLPLPPVIVPHGPQPDPVPPFALGR
jgi:hypothetical protein